MNGARPAQPKCNRRGARGCRTRSRCRDTRISASSRRDLKQSHSTCNHATTTLLDFGCTHSPIISVISTNTGDARADQSRVADNPEREAHQDRREGRQPWALCRVSDGRGCHSENSLRRHLAAHCGIAAAARQFDRVRRSIVMRWLKLTGEACLDKRKFDMSRLWTGRWPGRTSINNAYWRFRLVWQAKPCPYEPETGDHLGDVR
jgi:hypothetical protein